jgi:ABC-type multidrug transport system ATPase subunit
MNIHLNNVGKKFNKEWIFKDVNWLFAPGEFTAIVGNNGSGKSTLLQVIGSFTYCSLGDIRYNYKSFDIHPDKIYQHLSFSGPYQELMEELSLEEHINFHLRFRNFKNNLNTSEFLRILNLEQHRHKLVYQFSSGMKQRLKLALAILSDTPLLLLDEPVSNLDNESITWYKNILSEFSDNRTIIISSNHNSDEIFICNKQIDIRDYKIS